MIFHIFTRNNLPSLFSLIWYLAVMFFEYLCQYEILFNCYMYIKLDPFLETNNFISSAVWLVVYNICIQFILDTFFLTSVLDKFIFHRLFSSYAWCNVVLHMSLMTTARNPQSEKAKRWSLFTPFMSIYCILHFVLLSCRASSAPLSKMRHNFPCNTLKRYFILSHIVCVVFPVVQSTQWCS